MIGLLGFYSAYAAPSHSFAVYVPPEDFRDLNKTKRHVRFWWDHQETGVDVQVLHNGRWKSIASSIHSGHTTRPLPLGSQFRIKDHSESEWSKPFAAESLIDPFNIAMLNTGSELHSQTIGELSLDDSILWGATLGGGLMRLETRTKESQFLGPYNGIPSSKVISVDANDNHVLVGTSEGSVLLENGHPKRYWDSELPNAYSQSVRIVDDAYWIGTYEGLFIETPENKHTPLSPMSVFSIEPISDKDVMIGYQGLRLIDGLHQAQPLLESQNFHAYDILHPGSETYFATEEKGVQRLTGTQWSLVQNVEATQLSWGLHGLWMAAGKDGLMHASGKTLFKSDGLAGNKVWSVASQGQQLWAGTNGGLSRISLTDSAEVSATWHLPVSSTPVERQAKTVLTEKKGVFMAGPSGVWHIGKPHRHANNLDVAAPRDTIALLRHNDEIWAFGKQTAVWMNKRGTLDRINLADEPLDVVLWQNQFWMTSKSGIWRIPQSDPRPHLAYPNAKVKQLVVHKGHLWGIGENGVLANITPSQIKPFIQTGHALQIASSGDALCVGTENGLERYWHHKEMKVEDVLGSGDLGIAVTAVAGDQAGGCWFGGEEGTVGWVGTSGAATKISLPGLKSPRPLGIFPIDEQQAWVLTSKGTWYVRLTQ